MVLVGAVILIKRMSSPSPFENNYTQGRELYVGGNPTDAVPVFARAVQNATTPAQEGPAKLNLGTATLFADPVRGIGLLKDVARNEQYEVSVRADAIVQILQYWDLYERDQSGGVDFARTVIFSGDPWGAFVDPSVGTVADIRKAEEKALDWAARIYPLVAGEYTLAKLASEDVLTATSTADRQEAVTRTEQYLARGALAMMTTQSTASQIAIAYVRQGEALENLDAAGVSQTPQAIEDAFQHALGTSLAHQDSKPAQYYNFFARFRIASLEARRGMDHAAIQQFLDPIMVTPADARTGQLFRLLTGLKSVDTPVGYRRDAVRLAAIDPKFADLLVSLGWADVAR